MNYQRFQFLDTTTGSLLLARGWKLILGKKPEMYRISKDLGERNNLSAEF